MQFSQGQNLSNKSLHKKGKSNGINEDSDNYYDNIR